MAWRNGQWQRDDGDCDYPRLGTREDDYERFYGLSMQEEQRLRRAKLEAMKREQDAQDYAIANCRPRWEIEGWYDE